MLLTKADAAESTTGYAQGGIAAALGPDDSPERHAADTLAAGAGLCDEAAVRVLVEEGPRYVRELVAWGAAFDRDPDGTLALAREGGHSVRRVLHARDATGREIGRVLWVRAAASATLRVVEHARAVAAIVEDGRCAGVRFLDRDGRLREARARATLVATGGAGCVYRETTNPAVATGDGIALAYRAGARVIDLEFVQFHPTVLDVPGAPRFLLSEALRGEGAWLVNADGERFLAREDPRAELAPRDLVARAIARERERTGRPVCLSLRHLPPAFVHARFPLLSEACRRAGLDLARDPIPVSPAAHYLMGGIATDLWGRTSIPGLFAAGESACTGVHGANRLASNSLLEGLVFGARAGRAMRAWVEREEWAEASASAAAPGATSHSGATTSATLDADDGAIPDADAVRDWMWRDVGLFRDRTGLDRALGVLEPAWRAVEARLARGPADWVEGWTIASLVAVGRLIARAARRREESRGAHFRSDFPARDDLHWCRRVSETIRGAG